MLSSEGEKLMNYLEKKAYQKKLIMPNEARNYKGYQKDFVTDDEFEQIYNAYSEFRKVLSESLPVITDEKIPDDELSFEEKIENHVINNLHNENIRTFPEFEKLTSGWKKGKDKYTMEEWYEIYITKIMEQPGMIVEFKGKTNVPDIAFRNKNKRHVLLKQFEKVIESNYVSEDDYVQKKQFPTNKNKKYYLHKLCEPGTYLIDIMFEKNVGYLICIEANSRYLYAIPLGRECFGDINKIMTAGQKTSISITKALNTLFQQGMKPKILTGDGEKGFCSEETINFLNSNGIKWEPVDRMDDYHYPSFLRKPGEKQTTSPLHSSLGIVDRIIRTLRDMAFEVQREISPEILKELVVQYNNAPHLTLSKYAGMNVSPSQMQNNSDLYTFICRRISQANYNVSAQKGYNLKENQEVIVYNNKDTLKKRRSITQPGRFFVKGFQNGKYLIQDLKGNTQILPRYRLDPI